MSKYIYELDKLNECLQKKEDVIIYGIGDYGKKIVDYLFFIHKEKKIKGIVITEKSEKDLEYRGIKIHEAKSFLKQTENCYVIIAMFYHPQEVAEVVNYCGKTYYYMTDRLYKHMGRKVDIRPVVPYEGIDFLLTGFTKCGTTSLHKALKEIDSIYLSEQKESFFFLWRDRVKEAKKILIDNYFDDIRAGQFVGMIEPTFVKYAEEIYNLFGGNIKILFLVRNPVQATFSRFKMHNRCGNEKFQASYHKCGKFDISMFDEVIDEVSDIIENGEVYISQYFYWIEQFWKYYPKEQTKIIFFEELIKEPNRIINDVLEFIGVPYEYKEEKLPVANEGNYVMADEAGFNIAKLLMEQKNKQKVYNRENSLEKESTLEIYNSQCELERINNEFNKAEKVYSVKMTNEQRKKLETIFDDSVRKLEKMLDKDLSELWF